VFDRLAEIKERQKAQEAERAECENIIRAAMMEHTTATAGAWKASWKAQTRKAQIVVDPSYAGALESSGITFTLKAESESRVLRITKNKGE
jgi:endonuclease I